MKKNLNIQNTKINRLLAQRLPLGVLAKARGPKVAPNYFYVENISEEVAELYLSGIAGKYLECSTDGATWHEITDTMPEIMPGVKLYLRGENESVNGLKVSCTKSFNVGGDITTLLEEAGRVTEGLRTKFREFFKVATYGGNLVSAGSLELLSVTVNGFSSMFSGCTSLTTAPQLPEAVATGCYELMFNGCASLTTAPQLPAMVLQPGCYSNMFAGCASLVSVPVLKATTLANGCYQEMFKNCSSLNRVFVESMEVTEEHATDWLSGVAEEGTIYTKTGATIYGVPEGWEVVSE